MKLQWIMMLIITSFLTINAEAKTTKKPAEKPAAHKTAKKNPKSKLTTDADFDGSTLHGRYQKSAETLATVESEKAMMNLLGNRKNFKDRLAKTGSER